MKRKDTGLRVALDRYGFRGQDGPCGMVAKHDRRLWKRRVYEDLTWKVQSGEDFWNKCTDKRKTGDFFEHGAYLAAIRSSGASMR